jgi:hypothetical protein
MTMYDRRRLLQAGAATWVLRIAAPVAFSTVLRAGPAAALEPATAIAVGSAVASLFRQSDGTKERFRAIMLALEEMVNLQLETLRAIDKISENIDLLAKTVPQELLNNDYLEERGHCRELCSRMNTLMESMMERQSSPFGISWAETFKSCSDIAQKASDAIQRFSNLAAERLTGDSGIVSLTRSAEALHMLLGLYICLLQVDAQIPREVKESASISLPIVFRRMNVGLLQILTDIQNRHLVLLQREQRDLIRKSVASIQNNSFNARLGVTSMLDPTYSGPDEIAQDFSIRAANYVKANDVPIFYFSNCFAAIIVKKADGFEANYIAYFSCVPTTSGFFVNPPQISDYCDSLPRDLSRFCNPASQMADNIQRMAVLKGPFGPNQIKLEIDKLATDIALHRIAVGSSTTLMNLGKIVAIHLETMQRIKI